MESSIIICLILTYDLRPIVTIAIWDSHPTMSNFASIRGSIIFITPLSISIIERIYSSDMNKFPSFRCLYTKSLNS